MKTAKKGAKSVAQGNRSTREWDAELLRCISCFFVIILHSSGLNLTSSILLNSISRFCVPVFIIISGRFCLTRAQSIQHYLEKCVHFMAVFLFWSSIYTLCEIALEKKNLSLKEILTLIVKGPIHFWYLYALIALYLLVPILYVFCNHATREQLIYFFVITFFFGSIIWTILSTGYFPLLELVVGKMKIGYTVGFLLLFMFGYYREQFCIEKRYRILLYGAGLLGLAVTFLGTCVLMHKGSPMQELLLSFFAPNIILYSLAIYVFLTEFKNLHQITQKQINLISKLSNCTFGIYLLHPLLLEWVIVKIPGLTLFPNILYILVKAILTFFLSFFFVNILKKSIIEKVL